MLVLLSWQRVALWNIVGTALGLSCIRFCIVNLATMKVSLSEHIFAQIVAAKVQIYHKSALTCVRPSYLLSRTLSKSMILRKTEQTDTTIPGLPSWHASLSVKLHNFHLGLKETAYMSHAFKLASLRPEPVQ